MITEKTFLTYQEQAEGLIKDQQRLIDEQRKTAEELRKIIEALNRAIRGIVATRLN